MTTQDKIYSYFDRNPRLHVLFVFDPMCNIESELSECTWKEGYRYVVFDGGWFNAKYSIENTWKNDRVVILFQNMQNPIPNQDWMQQFPLMDVLVANMDYKVDNYAAFIQQHNISGDMATFVQRHVAELQQQKVSKILSPYYGKDTLSIDVAIRGLLSAYAGVERLLDWENIIIRLMILDASGRMGDVMKGLVKNGDVLEALNGKLRNTFGVEIDLNSERKLQRVAESLKYNSITQTLVVDKVRDDYRRYKIESAAALQHMNALMEVANTSTIYRERFADAMKTLAAGIRDEQIIKAYGIAAPYHHVTREMALPIVATIVENAEGDPDEAIRRMNEMGNQLASETDLHAVLRFGSEVASYQYRKRNFGTLKLNTPQEYIIRYTTDFAPIDTSYRRILEAYYAIDPETEHYDTFHNVKIHIDHDYADLCNKFNTEWLQCVRAKGCKLSSLEGVVPQASFYDKYREREVKQVVIVVDALRYELAQELALELGKKRHTLRMEHMLAMLPTETKYCKDALLPWKTMALKDMNLQLDGTVLNGIDQRGIYLGYRESDAQCIAFEDVEAASREQNREFFKRPLVYIYHNDIDEAGHGNGTRNVVETCSQSVRRLADMVNSLHASWNVTSVVVTADHGFLFNDIEYEDKDKVNIREETVEKKTRYYLTQSDAMVSGIIKFPLREVSAIDSDLTVAVPCGTNRIAAPGGGGYQFAHGGASLQEMIVPVLVSRRRDVNTKDKVSVLLMDRDLKMVSSRTKFRLLQAEAVSTDVQERLVRCALYVGDEQVTAEKEVALNSTDVDNVNKRIFEVELTLNKSTSASVMQLRVYDVDDDLNPLFKENVRNNTLIEQDF